MGIVSGKGRPVFHYNYGNIIHTNIAGSEALKEGKHTIVFDFKYDGGGLGKGGLGTLSVDGRKAAEKRIEKTIFNRFTLDETFDVGEDTGTPVNLNYDVPFKFTGKIEKVEIKLEAPKAAEQKKELSKQEKKAAEKNK